MCMDYQRSVSRMFDMNSGELIPNSRQEHAAVLISEIIRHAKDYVHIFCRNMRKEVYGTQCVIDAVKDAAARNVSIEFIITEEKPEESDLTAIKSDGSEVSDFNVHSIGSNAFNCPHFAVSDGKAYRLENSHDQASADGCANDPCIAGRLEKIFRSFHCIASKTMCAANCEKAAVTV